MFFGRFTRFATVGAVATGIQYLLLLVLVNLASVDPVLASSLGFIVSAFANYILNYHYTYRSDQPHGPALLKFMAIASIGLALNAALMQALVVNGWHYLIAQLLVTAIVLLWNYTGNTIWTFGAYGFGGGLPSRCRAAFANRLDAAGFCSGMHGFRRLACYAFLVSVALALAVYIPGQYIGAAIVESAYQKESIAFINSLITGQDAHSLSEYLHEYAEVVTTLSVFLLLIACCSFLLAVAPRRDNPLDAYLLIIVTLSSSCLLWLVAESRHYLNYLTETDFITTFLPEAIRFVSEKPLQLTWHPPGYPIALSLFHIGLNDWFRAGIALTIVSSALTLVTSFYLFRLTIGRMAAWVSVATTLSSGLFILFSCVATSDLFFLALFYAALASSVLSIRRDSSCWRFMAGAISAIAILVRTNAITLVPVLLTPLCNRITRRRVAKNLFMVLAGFSAVLALWLWFADHTHSNRWPAKGTAVNLATTYFAPREVDFAVASSLVMGKYESPLDVIAQDPMHVFKQYVLDLSTLAKTVFFTNQIASLPANLLALLGIMYVLYRPKQHKRLLLVVIFVLAQLLLVNLKVYESRYYLFLVPLLGAFAGIALQTILARGLNAAISIFATATLSVVFAVCLYYAASGAVSTLRLEEREVAVVVEAINRSRISNQILFSVKPHVAHYTGNNHAAITYGSVEELRHAMASAAALHDVFLLFGSNERGVAPMVKDFSLLGGITSVPPWLTVLEYGKEGGGWILYRFNGQPSAR